jgi:polygalacturonase
MRFYPGVVLLQAVSSITGTSTSSKPTVPCSSTAFSPLEFGAKFDGVSDDTQAWMRTIAAALNCSLGVAVVVPAGRSLLSATLLITLSGNQALQ